MKQFITLMLVLLSVIGFSSYAITECSKDIDTCMENFNNDPSAEKLIQIIGEPLPTGSIKPLQAFATMALFAHPKMLDDVIEHFPQSSPQAKQLMINALHANQLNDDILKNYNIKPQTVLLPNQINQLEINNDPVNLDILWFAYDATGNIQYPKIILEYISKSDDYLLKKSYTLAEAIEACSPPSQNKALCLTFSVKQFKKDLEMQYPKESKTIFHRVAVLSSALWSMNAKRKSDPDFNKKILNLTSDSPQLNYVARLFNNENAQGYWVINASN